MADDISPGSVRILNTQCRIARYLPYRGRPVTILRPATLAPMFTTPAWLVEHADGWRGVAFEDELTQ